MSGMVVVALEFGATAYGVPICKVPRIECGAFATSLGRLLSRNDKTLSSDLGGHEDGEQAHGLHDLLGASS
jgi:hypothetical protein